MSNGLRWRVDHPPALPIGREQILMVQFVSTHQKLCFHPLETMLPPIGKSVSTGWKQNIIQCPSIYHPLDLNISSIEHQYIIDRTSIYHRLKTKTSSIGWNLLDNSAESMYPNDNDSVGNKPFTVNDCHHGSYMARWRIWIWWYTLKIPLSYFLYSFSP